MLDYYVGNNDLVTVTDEKQGGELALATVTDEKPSPPKWKENRYVPTQPSKLDTLDKREYFLALLVDHKYIVRAADAFGCSRMTVHRRMTEDMDFAAAIDDIQTLRGSRMLADIEEVSESEAVKPGRNSDRLKQLDALAPEKYRRKDATIQVATQVNITLGYQPPRPPAMRGNSE